MNGPEPLEGTVEVCFNDTYGSICHDHWSESDAQVVCHSLGYNRSNASSLSHAFYGTSSGPIYLSSVQCMGDELSLASCSLSQDTQHCSHDEVAGVSCSGKYILHKIE